MKIVPPLKVFEPGSRWAKWLTVSHARDIVFQRRFFAALKFLLLAAIGFEIGLAAQVVADDAVYPFNRSREAQRGRAREASVGLAFFEAFPESGRGVAGVCSTTAPTGARGEVLTFTRASSATCTKTASGGLATTGIADGDLVVLSTNVARVEYDSAGTLGLLVESARTNSVLRSQQMDPAGGGAGVWALTQVGASGITVTADAAVAPDGTSTAERFQIPATGAATYAIAYQNTICNAATCAYSLYVKGNAESGSIDVCSWGTGAAPGTQCFACAYVASSWSRCTGQVTNGGISYFIVGHDSSGVRPTHVASDVFVWQAQAEIGAGMTSPIPTTSAAVTRAVELAYFSGFTQPISPLSFAASRTGPATSGAQVVAVLAVPSTSQAEGTNLSLMYNSSGSGRCWNNANYTGRAVYAAGTLERIWCAADYANATPANRIIGEWPSGNPMTLSNGGNTGAPPTAVGVRIGDFSVAGTAPADGIVSRVCVDPSLTRCR